MLPLSDLVVVVAISLACAVSVGLIGLVLLRATRRAPMLVRLCVMVATAIVSVSIGIIAVAQAMYLSDHDLMVISYVSVISGLVSVGVALLLARGFTRDSARLRAMARALGDGEPITATIATTDSSEFAALARDLATTSRKLAAAREEVAALDASRRELVTWISHDLRTPLAGLRAMAEALEDGLADDPTRFHRQMRSQVDHLTALVDDLFEFSKIHSGALALTVEPVSLYDLVSDSVAELGALARSRSISLTEAGSGDLTVAGDPRELARVIGNLLINAIQHSPHGSEISITGRRDGDSHVMLTVEDAGGGIPEADLSKIFQAGWRATSSRTPEGREGRSSGAGLGLAIVQGIVEAHDGDISVRNVPGGCRFDVRLPRHGLAA
ncbi:MAG: HAMP domain-containing sensor histidine kinase [Pseudolysinimonas sp.]|uniref:sensor histidine kinase n=1 Tax=Pseudolysinimonas sp. TaxID=2680009 RepID=UPI003262DB0E